MDLQRPQAVLGSCRWGFMPHAAAQGFDFGCHAAAGRRRPPHRRLTLVDGWHGIPPSVRVLKPFFFAFAVAIVPHLPARPTAPLSGSSPCLPCSQLPPPRNPKSSSLLFLGHKADSRAPVGRPCSVVAVWRPWHALGVLPRVLGVLHRVLGMGGPCSVVRVWRPSTVC